MEEVKQDADFTFIYLLFLHLTGDRPSKRLPDFEGPLLFIIMSKLCPGTFSNNSFTQSPILGHYISSKDKNKRNNHH